MTTSSSSFAATPDVITAQQRKLEDEKARLETELQRIARKDPSSEDYHAVFEQVGRGQDENASEEEQYEAARSVEQSLEVQLRDVNAALARIASGTYGLCGTCRAPIDQQRLEALPSARFCRQHAA